MNEETSMDQLFLEKVHEAIENNMGNEHFGVDELAHEIRISRSQLHRSLKLLTGQSPSQMIREFRLKRAMEMLRNNVATAAEISYQVGFSSPSHFNTCFKEYFGYPPGKAKPNRSFGITRKYPISRKLIFISTGTLVVLVSVFVLYFTVAERIITTKEANIIYESIAVLPFEDMSPQKDQEYFCDGMAEVIINALTHIEGLKVIPRTSAFSFKGKNDDFRDIGNELGVQTLFTGSVQKEGNSLRITCKLIEVKDGSLLWSEQYNRDTESIFDIQDEISLAIADKLKVELSGEEKAAVVKRHTENLAAYDYYLHGNDYYWRSYTQQDWSIAIKMFQKAIELDPNFALAYTRLAMSHLMLYWFHYDWSQDRLMKSKQAIDAAFLIEPELMEAYIALGCYYYQGLLDYSQALKQFEIALKQSPKNAECNFWIGCVLRRTGNWGKAKEYFNKAFEIDPRSSRIVLNTGQTYEGLREYAEALHYCEIAIRLKPDWISPYYTKSRIYLKWKGNTQKARAILREADQMITSTEERTSLRETMILLELYGGNYLEALKYLRLEKSIAYQAQHYFKPCYQYYALLYGLLDNPELEYAYHDSSRLMLEDKISGSPDDPRLYSSLGIAFAGLGRKKEAIEAGKKAVELLPLRRDANGGTFRVEDLARIYVMVGEHEKALERIELLLSIPADLSTNLLQLDPAWKPLWDHPEFIRLIEKYAEK